MHVHNVDLNGAVTLAASLLAMVLPRLMMAFLTSWNNPLNVLVLLIGATFAALSIVR